MDAHEYVFVFQNLNIYVFSVTGFLIRFFSSSGSVSVFGVDQFGSGNFDINLPPCIWTTRIAYPLAFVSTLKGFCKLGNIKIGAKLILSFSSSKSF
jgi:hypothetical protein